MALHTYLRHSVLILIAGLELTSCTTVRTTAPGAVGIEREQHMLVSEGNVEQGAERAYAQELQKARELGKLNQIPELAELAAVIGHEISHALREHTRERVSRAYTQQITLAGLAVVTGAGQGALDLANQVATVTFQLPHSREQESEADMMGLELMA